MTLQVWTQKSGYSLGIFQEKTKVEILLPVNNDIGVKYKIISGELPSGLRLVGNTIIGTPFEVPREMVFMFCIRASLNADISDRTLKITIEGATQPEFITPSGNLNIGLHNQYFVMDRTYIDYQIEAYDSDIGAGQHLSYFIEDDDGELPPGLSLSIDGKISGYVKPVLTITAKDGPGWYDSGLYDIVAYDFGYSNSGGTPKKLNRNYSFVITITDGDSVVKRRFNIFVVGDDYFRADNTIILDGTGLFTADNTYLREPMWITNNSLGKFRANNYIVLFLDTYDKIAGDTTISYDIVDAVNSWMPNINYNIDDLVVLNDSAYICTTSHLSGTYFDTTFWGTYSLPPGMEFDYATADIFGSVPYQPAITKTYWFIVSATRYGDDGSEMASTKRTFNVQIIGEIDSVLSWITPEDLGTINANYTVTNSVQATTTVKNAVILYTIIDGNLPNGLHLDLDGEIIGSVNQFSDQTKNIIGLTTFDYISTSTTFDGDSTSFDRSFKFTIQAADTQGYSAITRTFHLHVDTPTQRSYSNIRVRPFLPKSQRSTWKDFIFDSTIFVSDSMYRVNDPEFGVQSELSMIVYAGIETTNASAYVSAMGLNHKKKRFHFGNVKKAIAKHNNRSIYEVIYIEMIDPLEPNNNILPDSIEYYNQPPNITVDKSNSIWDMSLSNLSINSPDNIRPDRKITADSTGYSVSNDTPSRYYPSSITNWQKRLSSISATFNCTFDNNLTTFDNIHTERNYLPLWMRSIQTDTKRELGFRLAIPLCYCKVGMADDILLNIKHSGFDFKMIDYTIDRFIIDSVGGYSEDKYLVFRNDRITI